MSNFEPMKRRPAGSVHEAVTRAFGQLEGGVTGAAELLDLSRQHVHAMGDPDAEGRKKVNMSLLQAARLSEGGATALAEWLAIKAGGLFIPCIDRTCAAAIQEAVANYSRESGEAIGAAIDAALLGGDRERAVREIDEASAALARVRAKLMNGGNVTPLRSA
ncbi:hypothetical protein E4M02_11045 [Brevundimonas sp. S30B]|uniref:hypothetical protein n=1 Tax=unclassified Brevundimonas TaxID=2622653 RepID=UPI0010719A06|nr:MULTISPECIES: hypothetical protein [unclassified Brevundimonas]QBX38650.1 hypothetical protein E4M01_13305 [Brevundimonas sp. MF30-B]TFW01241.1 hypothetical protein E4M02_11045 [Brevundimonas sp. S30B]